MASYTQNPDYQTYKVDPYQLPAQQIVQAIQTRNSYWDAGASQLKNAYSNFLNLDLTRKDNRDKLDGLMQSANGQLKKSTQTDLSLSGNVNDAMSAFDPIVKNDDIMGDNAITKFYKSQMSVAESYRNKDNGKGYSDMNVKYLMQGLQDYATDPNAGNNGNWRKYYNERKEYSPFHDVGAEVHGLLKDFKPTVFTRNEAVLDSKGIPTGYLRKVVDKEQTATELNSYLESNLSDAAKQQMRINGSVMYNKNYAALGTQLYNDNTERIGTINKQISTLTADLKNPKASDVEKKTIQDQIDGYNSQISDYQDQNKKMKSGDFGFIKDNYDQYAGAIYGRSYLKGVALSNQRKLEVSDTLSPDEVALTNLREANKIGLEKAREEFQAKENDKDRAIALLKIAATKKAALKPGLDEFGNPVLNEIPTVLTPKTGDESAETSVDYTKWLQDKVDTQKSKDAATLDWTTYINDKAKQDGIDIKDKIQVDRYISTFEKNNPNDPTYLSYKTKVEDDDFKMKALDWLGNKVESKIKSDNSIDIQKVIEESKKYNTNIQNMVKSIIDGKIDLTNQSTTDNVPLDVEKSSRGRNGFFIHFKNPKDKTMFLDSNDWLTANNIANKVGDDLEKKREASLSTEYDRFKGYREFTNTENPGYKVIQDNVEKKLGVGDKDITVRGIDRDGNVYVQLNSVDPKVIDKFGAGLKRLNVFAKTDAEAWKKDRGMYVIGNPNLVGVKLNTISDPKISLLKSMAELEANEDPNKNSYFQQPADWPLKLGNEYYKFEMHYVDGKEHWFPIHAKSGVKLQEENGGYNTIEQAASELSNPDAQNTIRKIILAKKPDYKFE